MRSRARSFTGRGAGLTALTLTAVLGSAAVAAGVPSAPAEVVSGSGAISVSPSPRAAAFGCMDMLVDENPTSVIGWVDVETELPYHGVVPASGWFAHDRPAPGSATASPEQVLRGMWSGDRAAWYSPSASADVIDELTDLVAQHPEWNMSVWPWPADRRSQMPEGISVAFATWGVAQMCEQVDAGVVEDVLARGKVAPGADGSQPPSHREASELAKQARRAADGSSAA